MERTRCDEQDVVGLDHAVARVDGRALHQRQQVALHALTGNVATLHATAHGNLVDLVQEDDAVLLDVGQRGELDLLVVDQLAGLFVHQQLHGFGNAHLALARLAGHPLHHALQLVGQFLHAGRPHDADVRHRLRHVDLDFLVIEFAFAQALAELLAGHRVVGGGDGLFQVTVVRGRALMGRRRQQRIQHALFGQVAGTCIHALLGTVALFLDGGLHQVADDRIHVLAHVAHLGELGGLDLDERRVGQPGQATGNLGLAHAGGTDHQDVLGHDLVAQRLGHLLATPAVAQRNGHRALGLVLADDVLVQFGDNLLRRHLRHSVSIVWFWLV